MPIGVAGLPPERRLPVNPTQLVAHGEPVAYFRFPGLAGLGLPHAMTTRHFPEVGPSTGPFGPEAVATLAAAGLDLRAAAWARQVHGAEAIRVEGPGLAGTADVLATAVRGLPLVVFTADCLAISLWEPDARVLAVAHAGWRGLVRGAVGAVIEAAGGLGARPSRLRAAISPAVGPCCYEVDAPVIEPLAAVHPERWEAWVRPGRPEHWMLDLATAAEDLLSASGIDPAHIEAARMCTACHPDLFYSYRKGHRGRLCSVAALP
jgi:YfiH family protein